MDGVVCDFAVEANAYLSRKLGVPPIPVSRWDWYQDYGEGVQEAWDELWSDLVPHQGFFNSLPVAPGALEGLGELRSAGHQLVFITSRPAVAGGDTERWLEARGLGGHHLILTTSAKAKQFTDTDTLLDDKGDTVFRHLSQGKSAVLFKRPWNRDWWGRVPSVSGWPEFVQLVEEMAK